ncbi:KAT8 regulatory NSL complex subunit 1 isoform X2 [Hemibagrus wyckioides]|uniref:KAT8 regulatory NSL complex subunit 1 isoform X2 n=1 Tax=Hemibagrus wyckioides TaxID=337641 RepID=UPI00266D544B|nr:KAT8 regulatory NSL complex subunit 1 isoform X2 [Hemibagrus wyckioides]
MYYYCNRTTMSASAAWPGAEGPQSCCGGGGGELVNGNGGGEISEAGAISEWESATCDSADVTRSASTDTREREDGAARGLSRCCRRSAAPVGGEDPGDININGADGDVLCPRCTGETRTAAAQRGECETTAREFRSSETAVNKRRGCSYSGASKRACFSGTSTAEEAALHCGGSETYRGTGTGCSGEAPAGNRQSRDGAFKQKGRGDLSKGAVRAGSLSFTCEMECVGGVINGDRRGCRTAKGRVRLCRVRSFLASAEGLNANGAAVAQLSDRGHCKPRTQQKAQFSVTPTSSGARADVFLSGVGRPAVNGGPCAGVAGEAAGSWLRQVVEARKRQVQLAERTDMLWRRLHAVQVEQVERHVTQQLRDLRRAAVTPNSAELSRLARSCSEVLRTTGGALDSDHTASSSGGGSDSEEEEEDEEGRRGRHVSPSRGKSVCVSREWQWMRERAWLGSRWVWLQAQVSELEYGIRALTELYTHLRQGKLRAVHSVPETPLRAPRPSPTPQDCRFRKRLTEDSAPSPPAPHSPTSSAARVRPLLRQCRHRLIRLHACPALGSKAVTLPCSCEPPAVCVLCGPPHPPAQEKTTWTSQSELDQRIHPVLSMPSGFPVSAHGVTPPLAGLQSHSAVRWMERRGQGQQKAGRVRRRLICPRPPSTLPPLFNTSGGSTCRGQRGVVSPGLLPHHVTDLSHLHGVPAATDTPMQLARRRRGEDSFDIDNLVMPVGLAGLGARVQKLQYKEILTPSWRELDSVWGASEKHVGSAGQRVNHSDSPQQPSGGGPEHHSEVEDLSDAVFLKRHAIWESRERSRWGSWAQRRYRGRSSSSSCGDGKSCRSSDQAACSPEPRQGKSSPCRPFCSAVDEPFYQMEDEQQSVQSWERRSFPLLEEELRWLQDDEEAGLEEDACTASGRSQSTDSGISVGSLELSPRTPQPHQLQSGGHKPASSTQDSDSSLPSSTPPSLPCPSTHQNPANQRADRVDATLL